MTTPHDIRLLYYYWIPDDFLKAKLEQGARCTSEQGACTSEQGAQANEHNDNDKEHTEHTFKEI